MPQANASTVPTSTSIIVSGFPRTGTTTMMRMLHYSGLEAIADAITCDVAMSEFAPYGSYELEHVGVALAKHKPSWTAGKVIKVVAPYVHWLSLSDRPLRVIFMLRDETEVISSLLAMRVMWSHEPTETIRVARQYLESGGVPILYVQYHDMVKYPRATALRIQDFLGDEFVLDIAKAVTAVDRKPRERVKGVRIKEDEAERLLRFNDYVVVEDVDKVANSK